MKRSILYCLVFCFSLSTAFGQNEADAFRFSQTGITGSARALGLGGAYSAVGGDLSSATTNPAGLAVYRTSSFSISPQFLISNTSSDFLGETGSRSTTKMNIPSWGFNFTGKNYYDNGRERREVEEGLKTYTFAIGVNQLENYTRRIDASGFNTESSISDLFNELANATGQTRDFINPNTLAGLAARTYVVDTLLGQPAAYYPAVNGGNIQQAVELDESGRRNEIFLSLAGNFEDVVYFGATFGIQSIRYEQTLYVQENDTENRHEFLQNDPNFQLESPMNEIRYENSFTTRGTGLNVAVGVIVRPVDQLRIGLSVKSPTYFNLRDEFTVSMAQNYAILLPNGQIGSEELSADIEPGEYRYSLVTPYQATLGLMYLFGKAGFISADVELADYTAASFSADDYDYRNENNNIEDLYQLAVNYRLGGELRFGIFRVRAGAAINGDPFTEALKEYLDYEDLTTIQSIATGGRRIFSGGFGVRQPNYFLDVTLLNQRNQDVFSPYTTASTEIYNPAVVTTTSRTSLVMTLGFTF
ncbi:MAG: hypothetical protein NWR72_20235 [Bacteroidia bacterium]|nr:hypothetical protein [Bacteroidia bacterium]